MLTLPIHTTACPHMRDTGCLRGLGSQSEFLAALAVERKRTERSHKSLLLLLIEPPPALLSSSQAVDQFLTRLTQITRATDYRGWYRNGKTVGVLFTDIEKCNNRSCARSATGYVGCHRAYPAGTCQTILLSVLTYFLSMLLTAPPSCRSIPTYTREIPLGGITPS